MFRSHETFPIASSDGMNGDPGHVHCGMVIYSLLIMALKKANPVEVVHLLGFVGEELPPHLSSAC